MSVPDCPNAEHWITFWLSSYFLEHLPLPGWVVYPAIALMYLPDTTYAIRDGLLFKGYSFFNERAPEITNKIYKYIEKYIPKSQSDSNPMWWQFWKTTN
jgi:hypothetical protein